MIKKLKDFFYTKILKRKYYKKGQCLGCGRCCKRIYVKTHKHVIKEEEEFEKLKYLNVFYSYLTVVDKDEIGLIFSCSNIDEKTNLCKIHWKRPGICRRYPQEELFEMGGEIPDECGYRLVPIIPFSDILKKELKKNKK